MDHLSTLFGKRQQPAKPRRITERGSLFDTILAHLNPPRAKKGLPPIGYKRLGYLLAQVPTKDIYSLISKGDDAQRRGTAWSAVFWLEIKPNQKL